MAAWKTVKLSEVCEIQRGGSPRPIENFTTDAANGINWIKIGDVAEGAKYITSTKEKIRPEGASRSRAVKEGDFLLSNSMSFGRPYILRTSGCIHDGWLVLRYDKTRLTEDYLYHVLGSGFVYAQFEKLAVGAVVKNLNSEVVKQVKIPLPPIAEQHSIAAILDQADALRAKRREALALLDELQRGIFIEMFGDPVTNPKGWAKLPLGQIFDIARGGSPRPIDTYITNDEDGINWVMIGDTQQGGKYIDFTKKKIRKEGAKRSRGVNPGDFLLTNSMSFGRPYIMRTSGCIHDGWLVLSPRITEFSPDFFYNLLGSPAIYSEFSRRAAGATVKNLNIDLVSQVEVAVPPLNEQRVFSEVVAEMEKLRGTHKSSLAEFDALFASLQHRAFRGER